MVYAFNLTWCDCHISSFGSNVVPFFRKVDQDGLLLDEEPILQSVTDPKKEELGVYSLFPDLMVFETVFFGGLCYLAKIYIGYPL